jgi:hypothetical protein
METDKYFIFKQKPHLISYVDICVKSEQSIQLTTDQLTHQPNNMLIMKIL